MGSNYYQITVIFFCADNQNDGSKLGIENESNANEKLNLEFLKILMYG